MSVLPIQSTPSVHNRTNGTFNHSDSLNDAFCSLVRSLAAQTAQQLSIQQYPNGRLGPLYPTQCYSACSHNIQLIRTVVITQLESDRYLADCGCFPILDIFTKTVIAGSEKCLREELGKGLVDKNDIQEELNLYTHMTKELHELGDLHLANSKLRNPENRRALNLWANAALVALNIFATNLDSRLGRGIDLPVEQETYGLITEIFQTFLIDHDLPNINFATTPPNPTQFSINYKGL